MNEFNEWVQLHELTTCLPDKAFYLLSSKIERTGVSALLMFNELELSINFRLFQGKHRKSMSERSLKTFPSKHFMKVNLFLLNNSLCLACRKALFKPYTEFSSRFWGTSIAMCNVICNFLTIKLNVNKHQNPKSSKYFTNSLEIN